MNQEQIVKKMEELSFFEELNDKEKETLASLENYILQFEPSVRILHEGEVDHSFYILLDGRVSLTVDKPPEITLAQLAPGGIFGDITLRGNRPRTNSISADDEVAVLKIDRPLIDKDLDPVLASKIKDQVIDLLVRRLDEMNSKLVGFVR